MKAKSWHESIRSIMLAILAVFVFVAFLGYTVAGEAEMIGKKIYERAFGRGCGTCHDQAQNPQLASLVKGGKLDRAKFEDVLKDGKGGMPKAIAEIMKNPAVVKAGYGEDQAVDALYSYLGSE